MKKSVSFLFFAIAFSFVSAAQNHLVDSLISNAPAYNEYNRVRRDLFAHLPVTENNIVFFGDSITDRCEWDELMENQSILNRGISGDRVVWMFDRYETVAKGHPAKLFTMCGVNDLNSGRTSADHTVAMIEELLTRFHALSPGTEIYLQSILPMNLDVPARAKQRGTDINQRISCCDVSLAEWCSQRDWVTYIDVASVLSDSEGMLDAAYTVDGLHLNAAGYGAWKSLIFKYVNN